MSSDNAAASTLFLGHNSDWWDFWLIASVVFAAVAATAVGVATAGSIFSHSREAQVAEERAAKLTLELEQTKNAAKQIDANLLHEQRLTSIERWRLRRVERAILPRSEFVNWALLIGQLKTGGFKPINIAVPDAPAETAMFGMFLTDAFAQAGLLKREITIPQASGRFVPTSSGGATFLTVNEDTGPLSDLLWQRFKIGGGTMSAQALALPTEWGAIPRDENTLLVLENSAALGGSDGQDGEGVDENGRPVPPP